MKIDHNLKIMNFQEKMRIRFIQNTQNFVVPKYKL